MTALRIAVLSAVVAFLTVLAESPAPAATPFARCDGLCNDIEKIRGLAFKKKVPAEVEAMDRFPGIEKVSTSAVDSVFKYEVWQLTQGRRLKLTQDESVVGIIDSTDPDLIRIVWE